MAEIVNLRQARKRKARAAEEKRAAENRAAFGQAKGARRLDEARKSLAERQHEAHRVGGDEGE